MKSRRSVPVRSLTFHLAIVVTAFLFGAWLAAAAEQPSVVRIWNWNIHDKKYQQKMYKLFNERHPDIRIDYSSISNTVYDQVLEAAAVSKDLPELFYPSGKMTFNRLRTEGLIRPLNECAPSEAELKAWIAQFPPMLARYVEGANVFNGKAYHVDLTGNTETPGYPLFYNKTLFREAGIARPPATYSELRQSAAKVTAAGAGKYYGIVHGMRYDAVWHYGCAASIAAAGGARGVDFQGTYPDLRDGKFHNSGPEFVRAFNVWIGMREDGSVFPGELTMEDEQAKMTFATNKAALQFGGTWNVGNYLSYNESCEFEPILPPTPEDRIFKAFFQTNSPVGSVSGYVVAATAKNPRAVWEVIKFISSQEYQDGYVQGGFGISYLPEANRPENFRVPQMYTFVKWGMDPSLGRKRPIVPPEVRRMEEFVPGIYPTQGDVRTNVYLGKAGLDALADLDRRLNEAFDIGIKKAQEAGIKVTKSDWVFPGYDIMKDYEPAKK